MFYVHSELDRAAHLRSDDSAIDRLFLDRSSTYIPVHRGRVLSAISSHSARPIMTILRPGTTVPNVQRTFLGLIGNSAHFAIDCSSLNDAELESLQSQATGLDTEEFHSCRFADLREIGPALTYNHGSLLAYARALVFWQGNAKFCTRCGAPLTTIQAGHVKVCTNRECQLQVFPRTDPAVIMLIHDGHTDPQQQRCLLGRSPAWPEGVFSTLAGFVEPGESLEQAVQREVFEESNIRVHNVIYGSSQPWPFPRSIMLGFHATALNTDIQCDPTELAQAEWFTRDELTRFGNWGDENYKQQLPRTDSIARYLINQWMNQLI